MSKKLNQLLSGVIIASTVAFSSAAFAANLPSMPLQKPQHHKRPMKVILLAPRHQGVAQDWHRALRLRQKLTPEQARTVTQSAIILYGNPNIMKVGDIKPIKLKKGGQGYQITIVSSDGKLLKTIKMNAVNGRVRSLPLR